MAKYFLYTDGAARGNPGPAGAGCVIQNEKHKVINTVSEYLDVQTNNQAEYRALLLGLNKILAISSQDAKPPVIECKLDSELVVEQMKQNYKVKDRGIKQLYTAVREIIMQLGGSVQFSHIPRAKNKAADQLANDAIDNAW